MVNLELSDVETLALQQSARARLTELGPLIRRSRESRLTATMRSEAASLRSALAKLEAPPTGGTTPEQRREVLRDYRWYRERGNDSADALLLTRRGLASAQRSARNYATRLEAAGRPERAAHHAEVADYYAASLQYLDTVLQPRVDAWNTPREPDPLEALSQSLRRHE